MYGMNEDVDSIKLDIQAATEARRSWKEKKGTGSFSDQKTWLLREDFLLAFDEACRFAVVHGWSSLG